MDISPHLEPCYHSSLVTDEDGPIPMVKISVQLSTSTPLTRIRVGIDAVEPFMVTRPSFIINSLSKFQIFNFAQNADFFLTDDSYQADAFCYLYYPVIPSDLNLTVTAAYINGKSIPVVLTKVSTLPLRLIVKPCSPIKEADYKVTISTNKPCVSLLDLFPGKKILFLASLKCK